MTRLLGLALMLCAFSVLAATPAPTVLTWTAPTANTDGTAITVPLTYNVYEYVNAVWTKIGTTAAGVVTYSVNLAFGTSTNFHVTAVEGTTESAPSNNFTKVMPAAPAVIANPPTNGVAK